MKHLNTLALVMAVYLAGATQHQLWVATTQGGANQLGAIYVADATGSNFHIVHDCDMYGSRIVGSMTLAPNGILYGVTETGGTADSCVVCSFDPLTGVFSDIHDFANSSDSGESALTGMTLAADGQLYGVTYGGGANGGGVIYTVDPTNNNYNPIHNFTMDSSGFGPVGGLLALSNGMLYGTTYSGGLYGMGTIFAFNPVSRTFYDLHDFTDSTGSLPYLGTLMQGADGKLYGMVNSGGALGVGVIYSLDLNGNVYTDVHDFDGANGGAPDGGLMQATDGNLYGMTNMGGLNNLGTIFKFNSATSAYSVIFNFDNLSGSAPVRNLTQSSTGKLFGTTPRGGSGNTGVIFSYDIVSNIYSKVFEFDSLGGVPDGDVVDALTNSPMGIGVIEDEPALSLFPNPATGSVTVTLNDEMVGATAKLTNMTGQLISGLSLTSKTTQVNIKDLPAGIYFVTIRKGETQNSQKLIVAE